MSFPNVDKPHAQNPALAHSNLCNEAATAPPPAYGASAAPVYPGATAPGYAQPAGVPMAQGAPMMAAPAPGAPMAMAHQNSVPMAMAQGAPMMAAPAPAPMAMATHAPVQQMPQQIQCSCGAIMAVAAGTPPGSQVMCPQCKNAVIVPAQQAMAMSPQGAQTIVVVGGGATPSSKKLRPWMGKMSVHATCRHCDKDVHTRTEKVIGLFNHAVAGGACIFGCFWGPCLIPYCVGSFMDVQHWCPECGKLIKTYDQMRGGTG